jgi:surface antigen
MPASARVWSELVLRVSYTGRPDRRQPPVMRLAAFALLALSITGCARLGLPFNEAAAGNEPVRGAALVSATVSDRVDPTDWLTVRQTLGRIPVTAGAGTTLDWRNALTDSAGTVSVLTAAVAHGGTLCRGFTATINDLRGIRRYRGQACRGADGWQLSGVVPDDGRLL